MALARRVARWILNIKTVRATSPAFMARKASFTSSRRPRRVIISSSLRRRPDAGRHAAADQRRPVERHVVTHPDEATLVNQHLFRVARQIGELVDGRPLPRQLGRLMGGADGPGLAEVGAPGEAVVAVAAEYREARDHVVPWLIDRKSTRLNSSHIQKSRMPSSA